MPSINHKDVQLAINQSNARWMAGLTSLSNLSDAQLRSRLGVIDTKEARARSKASAAAQEPIGESWPQSFDWRNEGKVTPIKDQGGCGSCVSFGSIAALESRILIQEGFPLDLSEGDLHFCSSHGASCDGWWPDEALNQLVSRGVCDEACTPYMPGTCNLCSDRQNRTVFTSGQHYWSSRDTMRAHISTVGPLLSCFDVYEDFYHYTCGVYGHLNGAFVGGHCVCVIGYDDVGQYWVCKNSWGTGWGSGGYFCIGYGQCGIDDGMWEIDAPISIPWSLRPKDQKDTKDTKDSKDKDKDSKDGKDNKDQKEDDKATFGREKLAAKEKDQDLFDPVRLQLSQLAQRIEEVAQGVDKLAAQVAQGRSFISPQDRPPVGDQALKQDAPKKAK